MNQSSEWFVGRAGIGEAVRLATPLGALILLYWLLHHGFMQAYELGEASYRRPVILFEAIRSLVSIPPKGLGGYSALASALAFFVLIAVGRWRGALFDSWKRIEGGGALRLPVGVAALTVAWYFSTYPYNLYFDQGHFADRALLLAWAALSLWKPIFLLPLAFHATAVMGQFAHPLGGYRPTQPILLIRFLTLAVGYFGLRVVWPRVTARHFLIVALTLIAASYLRSGVGKLLLAWPLHGHVHHLLFAAYSTGWLGFLPAETIESIGQALSWVDWLMVAGTLVLEVGIVAMFWSHRVAAGFLLLGVCFHVGVFAVSGICFWQWVLLDLALAWVLLHRADPLALPTCSKLELAVSVPLILGGMLWFQPAGLNWLDTRLNYSYRFEGVGDSGAAYRLPSSFFSPYEYEFNLGFFDAYVRDKRLDVYWGSTMSRDVARALLEARDPEAVEELEAELGYSRYDANKAAQFDAFIAKWASGWNARGGTHTPFRFFPAPSQLWTYAGPESYRGQEPLKRIDVYSVTSLFDDVRYREFRRTLVREVDVPDR